VVAAWALRRPAGLVVALASGLMRGFAVALNPGEPPTLVVVWNSTMQTLINLAAALAVSSIANLVELADRQASIDPLTGLWNRWRFVEELELELERPGVRAPHSRSSTSTSTASRSATTVRVTRPEIACSSSSRSGRANSCAPPIAWHGSGVMSSPSSYPASNPLRSSW
jgi:hypothetical protein